MAGILTECFQQIPNLNWQPGQPISAPVRIFWQIKYIPFPNDVPDLDQALSKARVDCGKDLQKQLIKFGGAAKVWMTVQVKYEPVNPMANKKLCEQYLSAAPTRIFKSDETTYALGYPYIDSLLI